MVDYEMMKKQAEAFLEGSEWDITLYANVSSLLYENMEKINWAGFYLIRDGKLQLGPFQGKPACMSIAIGKGVCGTAVRENRIVRVDDVHQFPGHIACDSASESEIVLPIRRNGEIIGVLDIDSTVKSRFTQEDEDGLKKIAEVISSK